MRIDADAGKGEFGHVGAADEDRPGGAQPGDDRRVARRRRPVVERLRAGQGGFARDVEEVLDRHRQAGEGRGDIARLAQAVLGIGGGACALGVDFDEAARAFPAGSAMRASAASISARLEVRPAARSSARLSTVGFCGALAAGMTSSPILFAIILSHRSAQLQHAGIAGHLTTGPGGNKEGTEPERAIMTHDRRGDPATS